MRQKQIALHFCVRGCKCNDTNEGPTERVEIVFSAMLSGWKTSAQRRRLTILHFGEKHGDDATIDA
jgi:hypothetical protein